MPIGGSATCSSTMWWAIVTTPPTGTMVKIRKRRHERQVGRELEDEPVGPLGEQVLLEEQLGPVRERLQQPERPGPVRADPVLHVGDDLALEPDHEHDRHQQHAEGDEHLDEDDDEAAEVDAVGRRADRRIRSASPAGRRTTSAGDVDQRRWRSARRTGVSADGAGPSPRAGDVVRRTSTLTTSSAEAVRRGTSVHRRATPSCSRSLRSDAAAPGRREGGEGRSRLRRASPWS